MTPEQRDQQLDALITIAAKHSAQIAALTGVAEKHTERHAAVDARLEALIAVAEQHSAQIAEVSKEIANLERQWQAYINTLPRQ